MAVLECQTPRTFGQRQTGISKSFHRMPLQIEGLECIGNGGKGWIGCVDGLRCAEDDPGRYAEVDEVESWWQILHENESDLLER